MQFCNNYDLIRDKENKKIFWHFDLLSKNIKFDMNNFKLWIFDWGDSWVWQIWHEFANINFGWVDILNRINIIYPIDINKILSDRLFAKIWFYVNKLNWIEKKQKDCYKKLIDEIDIFFNFYNY